jgi:HSP20 family protein
MFPDITDFASDIRRAFDQLERQLGARATGECVPPIDVYDTEDNVTIVADLPGVTAGSVRALLKRGVVLIVGEKRASACPHGPTQFHVAERGFGRFARAVRLTGAFDASGVRGRLAAGVLRIVVPRLDERRGRELEIPIDVQ